MKRINLFPIDMDIQQEFKAENYEKVIRCADHAQRELLHCWHVQDFSMLEHLTLMSRSILNFWIDSIMKNRLWIALIRSGAWIGTLETIEKAIYEKNMDSWSQKRIHKNISSIKHLDEILQLLEVKGVATHKEIVEKLHLNHPSTLTEIMKKVSDFHMIDVKRSGKYKLYSLTDAGVRYARQLRAGENRQHLLKNIIKEYNLHVDEDFLDDYLRSIDQGIFLKPGQPLKLKQDNQEFQDTEIKSILEEFKPYNKKTAYLVTKTMKNTSEDVVSRLKQMEA